MTELGKLAIDFLVFVIWLALGTITICAILYAVGETVEHFTP